MVQLVLGLVARDPQLIGVDHDDIIARVHVRSEFRLVLAAEPACDLCGDAAENLAGGVHDIPVALHFMRLGGIRLHWGILAVRSF